MYDPQVLQVIYLAIMRYFAAKRQEKREANAREGRAIATDAPHVLHGASVVSEGERSLKLRQAARPEGTMHVEPLR